MERNIGLTVSISAMRPEWMSSYIKFISKVDAKQCRIYCIPCSIFIIISDAL